MSDLLSLEENKENDETPYKYQILREQKQEKIEKSDKTIKDCSNKAKRKYNFEDSKIPILEERRELSDHVSCERQSKNLLTPPRSPAEAIDKNKDIKTVNFNAEENYAQETPLMFSRSSSLDSLSDFDQHSIHDDHSSVISDFSHRTSRAVSPSELPDSPTQTVPPSPNKLKQQNFNNQKSSQQPQRMPIR